MCDFAYSLLLDRIERQVASERQVAAVLIAGGVKDVQLPTYDQAKRDFDAALLSEPIAVDRDRQELLDALGVR